MAKTVGNTTGQTNDFTVATGTGASDGDTQRVVTASDSPEAVSLAIMDDWDDGANNCKVVGPVGQGSANDTDNPVKIAGVAEATTPAAVDDGDIQVLWLTTHGQPVITFNRTRTSALIPTVDTAVYADLDRLGSVVTVSNAALRNGGSGMIVAAMLQDDALSNFGIEAFFFQVTPTLANADNGIWSMTDANIATAVFLGRLDFLSTSSTTYTDGRFTPGLYLGGPPAMHYTCASGDSAIYMSLRARGAYDAVATDDLTIYLELLRY